MDQHEISIEQIDKVVVTATKMVNPNRGIDENQPGYGCRRAGAAKSGWVPPRSARRRALSRSISAFKASRMSDDFSRSPV